MGDAATATEGRDVRVALLDAAEAQVAAVGGASVSLRAIARQAGVSHQAPAHFFESKRGLLTAVAIRIAERLADQLRAAAEEAESDDPFDVLTDIGMVYVEVAHASPALFALVSAADVVDLEDPSLRAARERCFAVLRDWVVRAQATGWRSDVPVDMVVLVCWVLVHGSAGLWTGGWLTDLGSDEAVRAVIREILINAR